MTKFFITISSIFILLSGKLSAQNPKFENLSLKTDYHYGFLLPEYSFISYFTDDAVRGFQVETVKKLKGEKLWQRLYDYPSVSLAAYYGSLANDTVFGKVVSLFPSFYFPLYRKNKTELFWQLGVGLAYSTEKFDLTENYYNIAVATHLNIWFRAALDLKYNINDKIALSAGTAFGHFSNANLSEPNIGLNFWTVYAGTDISISKKTELNNEEIPPFKPGKEFALIIAGGGKHTRRFSEDYYFAGSVSGEFKKISGYKFAFGTGADFFYDESVPEEMIRAGKEDVKNYYKIKTGIHISQELIIGKLSLMIQEGVYIGFTDHLDNYKMYNRGVVRYKFSEHFFADFAMKTNLNILDIAEIGIGWYANKK